MSPHRFVDKWDTPIMVTHGEFDYRILSSQGEMAFNAAKLRGIPAEMLIFPDENHWILKPQNAILSAAPLLPLVRQMAQARKRS